MGLDPARDKIESVSDLYGPFETKDHNLILKRCISIFEMLIDYHKNYKSLKPNSFKEEIVQAKNTLQNGDPKKIDHYILLISKSMYELSRENFQDNISTDYEEDLD